MANFFSGFRFGNPAPAPFSIEEFRQMHSNPLDAVAPNGHSDLGQGANFSNFGDILGQGGTVGQTAEQSPLRTSPLLLHQGSCRTIVTLTAQAVSFVAQPKHQYGFHAQDADLLRMLAAYHFRQMPTPLSDPLQPSNPRTNCQGSLIAGAFCITLGRSPRQTFLHHLT